MGHEVTRDGGAALGERDPLDGKLGEVHHGITSRSPAPSPGSKHDIQLFRVPHSIYHQNCIIVDKNGCHRIRSYCRNGAFILEKHNGLLVFVILNCDHSSHSENIHPITPKKADRATHFWMVEFQYIIPIEAINLNRTVFDTRSNKKIIISAGTHDNMIKDILYRILTYVTVAK